jgi:hypothetical protein
MADAIEGDIRNNSGLVAKALEGLSAESEDTDHEAA